MDLAELPAAAAWHHTGGREGHEVLFADVLEGGQRLCGATTATEAGACWSVSYDVELGPAWVTRRAVVEALTVDGARRTVLERSDASRWLVDGEPRPELDGCHDIDLESSVVTNMLPLRRLELVPGRPVDVPAAFVRAERPEVVRLDQRYTLVERTDRSIVVDYESATFDVRCRISYDASGLVVDYPGIAVQHG